MGAGTARRIPMRLRVSRRVVLVVVELGSEMFLSSFTCMKFAEWRGRGIKYARILRRGETLGGLCLSLVRRGEALGASCRCGLRRGDA